MAKVILTKERRMADRIIRCMPSGAEIGRQLGESSQIMNYRKREVYPKVLPELIKVLDLAGYEIKERED